MVNGLNINDELNTNAQLDSQLGVSSVSQVSSKNPYMTADKNLFVDEASISSQAMSLYQKDQDVQKFTSLATSDPQDTSANDLVSNLFSQGVTDPYSDETLSSVAGNSQLISDLGLE